MTEQQNARTDENRKEKIIALMKEPSYVPMKEKELACLMQVESGERAELKRLLQELLLEGKIQVNRRGRYSVPTAPLIIGTLIGHAKGFGFVEVEGRGEDLFIPAAKTNGACHQDTVEVRLLGGYPGGRQEAEVIRILARGMTQVVGTFQQNRSFGFVIPDNDRFGKDIFVSGEKAGGAVTGSKVIVEITDYGGQGKSPEGRVVELLGHINDPGVDILSIVRSCGIPDTFPEEVLREAEEAGRPEPAKQEASAEGLSGQPQHGSVGEASSERLDLRALSMVTIDGEDAKDLDDAVSLYRKDGRFCLGVHIADVSHYVKEGSALDQEALRRGTSVYLADRVIPMLPHVLSNGVCSLNAGEDRLALSCLMTLDAQGELIDYTIAPSIIRVDERMTYTAVAAILEKEDPEECARYECFVPMFREMAALSALIRERRHQRGAVDFDFPESRIRLDEEGRPLEIQPQERNTATRLIEDFMLLANETVAQHFYWLQTPFLYRTHETPDQDKMRKLAAFVHNLGYSMKIGQEEVHPKELQKLLEKAEGTPEESLIGRLTLRSMKQARYTTQCTGHFGLASRYYCHFTSPIRRYPDLQIHRIIKEQLAGRLDEQRTAHYEAVLDSVAAQTSRAERRADEAEREARKLKMTEYMERHIGEVYEGVISGITSWGLYVELPNTVEGLVHVSALPGDFFQYDEAACEMRGTRSGACYRLGERVRVQVRFADRFTRSIDFIMADGDGREWEADIMTPRNGGDYGEGSAEAGR